MLEWKKQRKTLKVDVVTEIKNWSEQQQGYKEENGKKEEWRDEWGLFLPLFIVFCRQMIIAIHHRSIGPLSRVLKRGSCNYPDRKSHMTDPYSPPWTEM